ncbi:hypothetical protein H8356DRAFT_1669731 [Neocallimastix lanati (nom. inval.)]|jgi:predicted nicotinamide N-methyase|uniref:S-adenosyl-L-methionine-dependent methyltransferase n=1 Tax=Neocallimastix californiae TaxID=1754190 RepID=A0A1Y2CLM8_9FUNG|nr:hypothetical protein H8356DRAFT_1669731 [Neocallimastix sp. JGI-2020a]ORY47931.1 hypothetical protein LY90DRAFT_703201 [Neocallimastix californiae]|eukprot:ORY47931.1 hypothetical protein LY90DRAFT_703201 [Neocallimastix californiae]
MASTKHLEYIDFSFGNISIRIKQNQSSLLTGTTIWDASHVLGDYLNNIFRKKSTSISKPPLQGKYCLELGSGCGLTGILVTLLGANTILTDRKDTLFILEDNVGSNVPNFSKSQEAFKVNDNENMNTKELDNGMTAVIGQALVKELDWEQPVSKDIYDPSTPNHIEFDYVLAADCVFNIEMLNPFINTLVNVCGPHTQAFVAMERRDADVINAFLSRVEERGFTWNRIPKSKLLKVDGVAGVVEVYKLRVKKIKK